MTTCHRPEPRPRRLTWFALAVATVLAVGLVGGLPAQAAVSSSYYVKQTATRTYCVYVGPSWLPKYGPRTVHYSVLGTSRRLDWIGAQGSGWQRGYAMVQRTVNGVPTSKPAARTRLKVTPSGSGVVLKYRKEGRSTVTSPKLRKVSFNRYESAGCPLD